MAQGKTGMEILRDSFMSEIKFSKEENEILVQKIKRYFSEELNQDLGRFDAEFLLSFFSKEIGMYFYNRGLSDAQVILKSRLESITDAIYDIEKPTEFSK